VIGIDHRHVYHLVQGLLDAGAACAGYIRHGSDTKGIRQRSMVAAA